MPGTTDTTHRRRSRLQQLRRRVDNAMFTRARYSQPMMPVMCLLGGLFMPLYWFLWTYVLPQPYSNLGLHLAGCAALVGATLLLQSLVPVDLDPRYMAPALLPLIVLALGGAHDLARRTGRPILGVVAALALAAPIVLTRASAALLERGVLLTRGSALQALEYYEAPFKFVGGGVYPSVFFLATGFHGFHVLVGTAFLIVCWFRARQGEFTPQRHFGFEAAAWYWHFVDVVWLFLFIVVYIWGGWGAEYHSA